MKGQKEENNNREGFEYGYVHFNCLRSNRVYHSREPMREQVVDGVRFGVDVWQCGSSR